MAKRRLETKSNTTYENVSLAEHVKLASLRESNMRLAKQLAQAKAKTGDLVDAVYRAAKDAAAGLTLSTTSLKIPGSSSRKRGQTDETALIVVSDLQLGKLTASYSSEVCAQRMQAYADRVSSLTAIQRSDHPVRHARLYLLGDIVEGELIFPQQPYQADASLYTQVMVDGPKILGEFLRHLLTVFETVHVCGVVGNHGRHSRFHNPTTNADRMVYRFLAEIFREEPRARFSIPDRERETNWYLVDYPVGLSHGILLFHGDQVRGGFAGFPFYGFAKRIWGWRAGAVKEPFKYAIAGHWHTPMRMQFNDITVWVNGSTESDNTWAQEQLAQAGEPTQLLLFAHPRKGVTAEYWVHL